jgi:ABC-type branched-subunit amino acid transport system substrate-binding protein
VTRPHRSPLVALSLVGLLALSGCGARVNDNLRQSAADAALGRGGNAVGNGSGSGGTTGGTSGGTTTGGTSTSGTSGATSTTGGTTGRASGGTTGGTGGTSGTTTGATTTGGSTGAGTSGSGGSVAPAGGNGGTTDVGVTANSITVGNVADASGPVPGLFRGAFVGTQAYFAMINSQGGVFGRQLKIDFGDSQLQCPQNTAQTEARVNKVFAFVGNFSLNDDCGETVLAKHLDVPNVSNALGSKTASLKSTYSTAPLGNGWRTGPLDYYNTTYGTKWQHIGAIFANVGTGPNVWAGTVKAIEHSGGKVVHQEPYGATDTDFTSTVIKMNGDGVKMIYINTTDGATTSRFVNAVRQQRYDWPIIFGATAYSSDFLKQSGSRAEGVMNDQQFAMFFNPDEAANIPTVADFQKWMQATNSDQVEDIFAAYGWTSAMLFVDALKKAGPTATRKSLFAALSTFTSYDSRGMFATSNPAQKKPAVCWISNKVVNGKFVRTSPSPAKGFICANSSYFPPVS